MLTVLGGLAEFERELILARTGDGRRRAKARGVRFGHAGFNHAPAAGSDPAAYGRRYSSRSRAELRCEPSNDIEVAAEPFRRGNRRRSADRNRVDAHRSPLQLS